MADIRLTKAQKQRLVEKALREKVRRQVANRKALEDRIAKGRRRIEKTVPSLFLPEIRRVVVAVLDELEAGREPRVRCVESMRLAEPVAPIVQGKTLAPTVPQSGTRGLGPAGRKRAQTARRRERQRSAGLTRTTFDVPDRLVRRLSGLVDQLVMWMSEGAQVILEEGAFPDEPVAHGSVKDAPLWNTTGAPDPDDLGVLRADDSDPETSPLFDDVQAAARLKWEQ